MLLINPQKNVFKIGVKTILIILVKTPHIHVCVKMNQEVSKNPKNTCQKTYNNVLKSPSWQGVKIVLNCLYVMCTTMYAERFSMV